MKKLKKKKEVKAKIVVWNTAKRKAPKGEIVRILPRYAKMSKKKKAAVLSGLLEWVSSELKKLC